MISSSLIGNASHCPLWVKSRHVRRKTSCPLYARKRTCAVQTVMSALGQKQTSGLLFNHRIGAQDETSRDGIVDRFSRFQIDHELELGWLLDRQLAGPGAAQHLDDNASALPENIDEARTISEQTAFFRCFRPLINRRQSRLRRPRNDEPAIEMQHWRRQHVERG